MQTELHLQIALIVILCNFVKVVAMFLTLCIHKKSALIAFEDAIESFLEVPEHATRGLCTFSADCIKLLWGWKDFPDIQQTLIQIDQSGDQFMKLVTKALPSHFAKKDTKTSLFQGYQWVFWKTSPRFWFCAASGKRWLLYMGL